MKKTAGKYRRCIEPDIRYGKSVRLRGMPAGLSVMFWHFKRVEHDRMNAILVDKPPN